MSFSRAIVLVIIGLIVLAVFFRMLREFLTFVPTTGPPSKTPQIPYVVYRIPTQDNEVLSAWGLFHEDNPQAPLLLYFHGNGGNLSSYVGVLQDLYKAGFHVLAADYRGYGVSTGKPSERGILVDAESVWNFATNTLNFRAEDIVLYGFSMGSVPASYLASLHPEIIAVVLHGGFSSLLEVPGPVGRVFLSYSTSLFTPAKYISLAKCPVIIVHAKGDSICDVSHSYVLFDHCKHKQKALLLLEGGHETYIPSTEYTEMLRNLAHKRADLAITKS